MKRYILKRLFQSIIVLFIMSICSFALINAAPGEPAAAIYGGQMDRLTESEKERINKNLGLDRPVVIRYVNWLSEVFHGNFGYSYSNGQAVGNMIKERMPNTLYLFLASFVVTVVLSILVGLFAGLHRESIVDKAITILSITFNGIPSVLVGILLILLFSVVLGWLPSSGVTSMFSDSLKDRIIHLILPTTIYLWLISLTASKELSILLLKLYNDGAIGISDPFLDFASVIKTDNQLLIRSVRFMQVESP